LAGARRVILLSRLLVFGAILSGVMALAVPAVRAAPVDGSAAFDQYCIACHGADARGIDNLGVDLVGSEFVARTPEAGLVEFLRIGRLPDDPATLTGRSMPGFSWVSEGELKAIAVFLKSGTGRHLPPPG
jgi:mono/diheme cytochrome c family protein